MIKDGRCRSGSIINVPKLDQWRKRSWPLGTHDLITAAPASRAREVRVQHSVRSGENESDWGRREGGERMLIVGNGKGSGKW